MSLHHLESNTNDAPLGSGPESPWQAWAQDEKDAILASRLWRAPVTFDALGAEGYLRQPSSGLATTRTSSAETATRATGSTAHVVAFASNDYLGLSAHPLVVTAAKEALDIWGAGSGASRLVTGSRPVHEELERDLADWKGTDAAVVFSSGYAANLGVLATLGDDHCRIFSDQLNHASIVDGARLARADVKVFRHRDVEHLEELISRTRRSSNANGPTKRLLVVTDSVFSMDGDLAPLDDLCECCERHGALLVIDEAHAVLGPELVTEYPHVVRVGTLSKTLGSTGGFATGPRCYMQLLVNRARPYIFTTAPTPASIAAAKQALAILRSTEGNHLKAKLAAHVARLAPANSSPIVAVVLGAEASALRASEDLLEKGVWVPAIRPPTVAKGTSRLRVSLSAAHTDQQVDHLLEALRDVLGSDLLAEVLPGLPGSATSSTAGTG